MNTLPPAVTAGQAEAIRAQMAMPDLVFLTEKNQELMKTIIDPLVLEEKNKELEMKRKEAAAPAPVPRGVKGDLGNQIEEMNK